MNSRPPIGTEVKISWRFSHNSSNLVQSKSLEPLHKNENLLFASVFKDACRYHIDEI